MWIWYKEMVSLSCYQIYSLYCVYVLWTCTIIFASISIQPLVFSRCFPRTASALQEKIFKKICNRFLKKMLQIAKDSLVNLMTMAWEPFGDADWGWGCRWLGPWQLHCGRYNWRCGRCNWRCGWRRCANASDRYSRFCMKRVSDLKNLMRSRFLFLNTQQKIKIFAELWCGFYFKNYILWKCFVLDEI